MSYLAKLKALAAEPAAEPPAPPFEGFEGDQGECVSPIHDREPAFGGFEGDEGKRVLPRAPYVFERKKERSSKYLAYRQNKGGADILVDGQTHLPHPPSKPSKGSASDNLSFADSLPADWHDGFMALSREAEPCPGFRPDQWPRTYDALANFMTGQHVVEAVRLGWPVDLLFGVHPMVGLANVAACGAIILADRHRVQNVTTNAITMGVPGGGRVVFTRRPHSIPSVAIWNFGHAKVAA